MVRPSAWAVLRLMTRSNCRLFNWHVGGLRTLEDLVDEGGSPSPSFFTTRGI